MTQLGKYDILKELSSDGFGIVYKTRGVSLDRVVALKESPPADNRPQLPVVVSQRSALP